MDDMGRSCVLWLDFRSDDHEQKSEVGEEVNLGVSNVDREVYLKVVPLVTYSLMQILLVR